MTYDSAGILLMLFCVLGIFDGLYFHLYKYKLHLHESSRREHLIHTLRAFVFIPISLLLFVFRSGGFLLYFALFCVAVDLGLELIDILEERESRKPLGGISSEETAIHVFASSFKMAAICIVLLAKDSSDYQLQSELLLGHLPLFLSTVGTLFCIGCAVGGLQSLIITEPLPKITAAHR